MARGDAHVVAIAREAPLLRIQQVRSERKQVTSGHLEAPRLRRGARRSNVRGEGTSYSGRRQISCESHRRRCEPKACGHWARGARQRAPRWPSWDDVLWAPRARALARGASTRHKSSHVNRSQPVNHWRECPGFLAAVSRAARAIGCVYSHPWPKLLAPASKNTRAYVAHQPRLAPGALTPTHKTRPPTSQTQPRGRKSRFALPPASPTRPLRSTSAARPPLPRSPS